ncbi:MAG: glycosyltransferase [Streptosporangiales bacterium]
MSGRNDLVVTVGTDHHPFDRLIEWVNSWLDTTSQGPGQLRCVVQHGASRPPDNGKAICRMPRDELVKLMGASDLVVGHAGPGTIADSRAQGRLPVVVPRLARLGEAVDDHQVAFSARLEAAGLVRVAADEQQLHGLLDNALAHPSSLRIPRRADPAHATARRFAAELRRVVTQKPPRRARRRV